MARVRDREEPCEDIIVIYETAWELKTETCMEILQPDDWGVLNGNFSRSSCAFRENNFIATRNAKLAKDERIYTHCMYKICFSNATYSPFKNQLPLIFESFLESGEIHLIRIFSNFRWKTRFQAMCLDESLRAANLPARREAWSQAESKLAAVSEKVRERRGVVPVSTRITNGSTPRRSSSPFFVSLRR